MGKLKGPFVNGRNEPIPLNVKSLTTYWNLCPLLKSNLPNESDEHFEVTPVGYTPEL